jgi:NAD(P)-dependent dehydrogenase (short-subunit alcohol dehydrogenase family)
LLQAAPKKHNSSVIVISSMSGLMRNAQAHFAYNAAKGATAHLGKMMSKRVRFDRRQSVLDHARLFSQ